MSGGSWPRMAATFSRTSAAAACASTSSRSSTPTREKPSVEVEITRLTPLMPATASSIALRDQRLDLFGGGAGEDDADVDEGEVDLGEEVDAQPAHRHDPEHHEAQDDHRGEDRALD